MQKTIMKNRTRGNLNHCDGQKGAVLVDGLLMTTVLTLVAVNGAKRTVVQQRMANNYRFSIEAMNNAETGFRSALDQINDQNLILNGFDDELDANGDGVFDDRFSLTLADPVNSVFFNVVMVDDDDGDGNLSVDANGIVLLMSQGTSSVGSTRTIEVRFADSVGGGGSSSRARTSHPDAGDGDHFRKPGTIRHESGHSLQCGHHHFRQSEHCWNGIGWRYGDGDGYAYGWWHHRVGRCPNRYSAD